MEGIITAWGRILRGYNPSLSIEITRECPLRCPGCYAYGDEHLRFSVDDTGPGVAPEVLPTLFDRFTQVDSSRKRKHAA